MEDSYDNRAIRMLLQPSIHLYNILNYYNDDNKNIILNHLVNEQIDDLIKFLNGLIENINEDKVEAMSEGHEKSSDQIELLNLQLHIRLFINNLRESYATVRDLLYHKDDSNVMNILNIVNKVLAKHNINSSEIGQEIFLEIMGQATNNNTGKTSLRQRAEQQVAKTILKDNLKLKTKK